MRSGGDGDFWGTAKDIAEVRGQIAEVKAQNAEVTLTISRFHFCNLHSDLCNFMIPIHDNAAGVTFAVKVHPRAKKNAITGEIGDALKVALTAPPVDGKANEACVDFLAKLLKVPRSSVSIISGHTSRNKMIRVMRLKASEVRERLAI